MTAFDIQPWISGPRLADPYSPLHAGPTAVWGPDPAEGYPVFFDVATAIELAAGATIVRHVETKQELEGQLTGPVGAAFIDWLHDELTAAFWDENEDDEGDADPLRGPMPELGWWTEDESYPVWRPLLRNEDEPGWELPASTWGLIQDEGWEDDTGDGVFIRIEDTTAVVDSLHAAGVRTVQDPDIIRRAAGPAFV